MNSCDSVPALKHQPLSASSRGSSLYMRPTFFPCTVIMSEAMQAPWPGASDLISSARSLNFFGAAGESGRFGWEPGRCVRSLRRKENIEWLSLGETGSARLFKHGSGPTTTTSQFGNIIENRTTFAVVEIPIRKCEEKGGGGNISSRFFFPPPPSPPLPLPPLFLSIIPLSASTPCSHSI